MRKSTRRLLILNQSGVLNALSPFMAKLAAGQSASMVFSGDSTSATDARIAKPAATKLAAKFPSHTVIYVPPDGSGGYTTPVTIQTGPGGAPPTLHVYNHSVSGARPSNFQGGAFDTAFLTPAKQWDVVWLNQGKNMVSGITQPGVEGDMRAIIAEIQLKLDLAGYPRPNIVVTDQYPNRDDTAMDLASTCWQNLVADEPTITRLNLKTGTTYVSGDFADAVHLSDAGYAAKVDPLLQAFLDGARPGVWTPATPWLLTAAAPNYLNGDSSEAYANFNGDGTSGSVPGAASGGVPAGWIIGAGAMTYTKDTSIKFGGNTRSQRVVAVSGSSPRNNRVPTAARLNALKGKTVMLTVLKYVDAGSATTVGRVQVNSNGTGGIGVLPERTMLTQTMGGWTVTCLGPWTVANDATANTTTLNADAQATPDTTHGVNFQWASLSEGRLPRGV